MEHLSYEHLRAACSASGPSVLVIRTPLAPAGGGESAIAPARYVDGRNPTYAFETRYVEGRPMSTVMVDAKSSQLNRVEASMVEAIRDGDGPLSLTPRIRVTYPSTSVSCMELPHRAFDGHIRAGTVDGSPVTQSPAYRAARDVTALDIRPLAELSGVSPVLGAWDSTRRSNQVRFRSVLVGEIIGVLADQSESGRQIPRRGGARRDEVAPSVRLSASDMGALLSAQEEELSPGNVQKIRREIESAKKGTVSASALGLGSIPPALGTPGLVACQQIVRSQVLSFAALRQLRFGSAGDGDIAGRALLAALVLAGLARSNRELVIRANCDLVELSEPEVTLDGRYGRTESLADLDPQVTDDVLSQAIAEAVKSARIRWEGQVFEVEGNPLVIHGASSDDPADAER